MVCIHTYDEYLKSIDSGVCHRPWSVSWLIVQAYWLTIEYQVVQFVPSGSILEQFESIHVTILQQILFLLLWSGGHRCFAYFTLSLSAAQVYMIQERCWFSQMDFFIEYFPQDQDFVSFQQIFKSSTYTDKNDPFSRCTKRYSQFGISPSHVSIDFSNCLTHNSPARRWPWRFRSRGTTGSSYWTMI